MSLTDDPRTQRRRIEEAVEHSFGGYAVPEFDDSHPPHWLRFRIDAKSTGRMLSNGAIEYHVSEIQDITDARLRQIVAALAPYFARLRA